MHLKHLTGTQNVMCPKIDNGNIECNSEKLDLVFHISIIICEEYKNVKMNKLLFKYVCIATYVVG